MNNFDKESCPTIQCLLDNGVIFSSRNPEQIQNSGFSLINGCDCSAPDIEYISTNSEPASINTEISITFFISHGYVGNARWEWGDGTSTEVNSEGKIVTSHIYVSAGVYSPKLILEGCNEIVDSTYRYIVVYDPEGSFVTGGGWIESPLGASVEFPDAVGKANFGFVSKYKKGATVPEGNTEFKFNAGNLSFTSTEYQWLVVAGSQAKFKGVGSINGEYGYGFMISAFDGDLKNTLEADKFRIKIWSLLDDEVVYDNQMGAEEDADPSTEIGGGSIVIHEPNTKSGFLKESLLSQSSLEKLKFTAYPNPFTNELQVNLELPEDSKVIIDLYAVDGRKIQQLESKVLKEGIQNKIYPTQDIKAGIYFLKLKVGETHIQTRKLIKTD